MCEEWVHSRKVPQHHLPNMAGTGWSAGSPLRKGPRFVPYARPARRRRAQQRARRSGAPEPPGGRRPHPAGGGRPPCPPGARGAGGRTACPSCVIGISRHFALRRRLRVRITCATSVSCSGRATSCVATFARAAPSTARTACRAWRLETSWCHGAQLAGASNLSGSARWTEGGLDRHS